MSAIENEHVPNGLDDKKIDKDSKVTNDNKWIPPKNFMPIKYFFKHTQTKKSGRRTIMNMVCW